MVTLQQLNYILMRYTEIAAARFSARFIKNAFQHFYYKDSFV